MKRAKKPRLKLVPATPALPKQRACVDCGALQDELHICRYCDCCYKRYGDIYEAIQELVERRGES